MSGTPTPIPSIFDVISDHPIATGGAFAIGGGLGYFGGKYVANKFGSKSNAIPLLLSVGGAGAFTLITVAELASTESFISQVQDSPILAGVSFSIGALVGGVGSAYIENLAGVKSVAFPLVVGVLLGLGTAYVTLKLYNWGTKGFTEWYESKGVFQTYYEGQATQGGEFLEWLGG
jgi:hypothetical protein